MKRLPQIIFNGLTVLSLLLCILTMVLWMRSYRICEFMRFDPQGDWGRMHNATHHWMSIDFISIHGEMGLQFHKGDGWPSDRGIFQTRWTWISNVRMVPPGPDATIAQKLGITFFHEKLIRSSGPEERYSIGLPYWIIGVATAFLPGLGARRYWRSKSIKLLGRCDVCGYDLRATPHRCPECGTVPEKLKV